MESTPLALVLIICGNTLPSPLSRHRESLGLPFLPVVACGVETITWLHEMGVIDIVAYIGQVTIFGALAKTFHYANVAYVTYGKHKELRDATVGEWGIAGIHNGRVEKLKEQADHKTTAKLAESVTRAALSAMIAANGLAIISVGSITLLALSTLSLTFRAYGEYNEYLYRKEVGSGYTPENEAYVSALKSGTKPEKKRT